MSRLLFETTTSEAAGTESAGARLAEMILSDPSLPRYITLNGELGAGKTEFTRGFVSVASPGSSVKSPTYTLVNEYGKGKIPVYHFDVYRIRDDDDLWSTGYYDYPEDGIFLVEWASVIPYAVPQETVSVTIDKLGGNGRKITVTVSE